MAQDQNIFIPFNKVVEKLIVQPILVQAEIVNKACLHLFIRKLRLVDHLRALKRYALLEAGDTVDLFLNTIFSPGFSGNLTAVWEGCLKMTSSKDDEFGDLIKISMKRNNLFKMQFKTVEDLEFLELGLNIKGPLELIFSPDRLEEYSKAFVSLLRVKFVTSILSNIKTFNVPMSHLYYRKIHFLRQKMQHFIDIYHGYVASELHGAAWRTLVNDVLKSQNLAEIVKVHAKYLDTIQNRCFLKESGTRVMDQLKMIFQLVMRFRNIVIELDEFSLREIEAIEDDFNSIHRFLFKMTQKMALNGHFPELFVRLDFNEYMTKKIERERVL
jgi:gamma-tubulin complex component 5